MQLLLQIISVTPFNLTVTDTESFLTSFQHDSMTQVRIRPRRKQKHNFFLHSHPNLPFFPLKSTKIMYLTRETGIFIICREAAFLMFIYLFIYYFLSYPSTLSPRFCIFSFAQACERNRR